MRQLFAKRTTSRASADPWTTWSALGGGRPAGSRRRSLIVKLQTVSDRIDDNLAGTAGEGLATSTLPRLDMLLQELTTTSRQLSDLLDGSTTPATVVCSAGTKPPLEARAGPVSGGRGQPLAAPDETNGTPPDGARFAEFFPRRSVCLGSAQ